MVHSVIIGIGLGVSETPKTIRPLVAAITFHQLFEGMGLGGCIAQVKPFIFTSTKSIQSFENYQNISINFKNKFIIIIIKLGLQFNHTL